MNPDSTQGSEPVTSDREPVRSRRRLVLSVSPLMVLLVLWIWLFAQQGAFTRGPNGKTLGADMAMFVTASRVQQSGGNPYDPAVLYRAERQWLDRQRIVDIARRPTVRVGNPPLMFWLLRPINGLPLQASGFGALVALAILSVVGLLSSLRYLGWRARVVPVVVFMLMPQVVLGVYYANIVGLVFAGLSLGLLLLPRRPIAAGALLTVAWLKPPVALPVVLLMVLFLAPSRLRTAISFAGTSLLLLLLTVLTTGPDALRQWVRGLTGYSRDIATSPSVSSLSGLYVRWAPSGARTALEVVALVAAMALTYVAWRRRAGDATVPALAISWLWLAWFLAAPYAHFFDEILLTVPVLAVLGRDGKHLGEAGPTLALYLTFFTLLVLSVAPGGVQPLPIPLLAIAAIAYRRSATCLHRAAQA